MPTLGPNLPRDPGSHPPALLSPCSSASPLFPDKPGDRTPGSRGTWSRSGLASPAFPPGSWIWMWRAQAPPSPQPVLSCPLASGPVWALLVPKSAEAGKGARPYLCAVFLEARCAPLAAHSHPARPPSNIPRHSSALGPWHPGGRCWEAAQLRLPHVHSVAAGFWGGLWLLLCFCGQDTLGLHSHTAPRLPVSATMRGTDGGWLTCCHEGPHPADEA